MALAFHRAMLDELLEENGLVVMAAGMGLHKVLAALVRLHHSSKQQGVLLLVNISEAQRVALRRELQHQDAAAELPHDINNEFLAPERLSIYQAGGVIIITSRILVVDLLNSRIAPESIAGIIVSNAHRVNDTSSEAFILRLYKAGKPEGTVRALSDSPYAFNAGFNTVERILRNLFVRRLYLWPRFKVQDVLDLRPPEVIEVHLQLTPYMQRIHAASLEVLETLLKELRRCNAVDVTDLTVENGLFKAFDETIRRQLDPVWHTVGRHTRQLVADLRRVRELSDCLLRYDAVSFLAQLDRLRVYESYDSTWMSSRAAQEIFEYARQRVYVLVRAQDADAEPKTKKRKTDKALDTINGLGDPDDIPLTLPPEGQALEMEAQLEEQPKWKEVRSILLEIKEEQENSEAAADGAVLVLTRDEYTRIQLEQCMQKGPAGLMKALFKQYVNYQPKLAAMRQRRRVRAPRGRGRGRSRGRARGGRGSSSRGYGRGRGQGQSHGQSNDRDDGFESHPIELENMDDEEEDSADDKDKGPSTSNQEDDSFGEFLEQVHFHAIERHAYDLDVVQPVFVVLYDPDVEVIRQLEVFHAERRGVPLRIYFIDYENSAEQFKFLHSIKREKHAFENLIRQKSIMMLPTTEKLRLLSEPQSIHSATGIVALPAPSSSSRRGGVRPASTRQPQIVVDMREFMSSLPSVLHQQGLLVVPVTLEVGDYILSPEMCVERKAVPDLISSLKSGRLYNQAEAMCRHYNIPVLLIEFEQERGFSLVSRDEIREEIDSNSVLSRLSLLLLHFPRLRLVWSRSLHATADMFDEPDAKAAAAIGVPSETLGPEFDEKEEEMLRRLPGITNANYHAVMSKCRSIADLADMSLEQLTELLASSVQARKLKEFLDQECTMAG
eukprot:jgi/Chlat1/2947/Chrsp2S04679